jgi:hypothetical protein
MNNFASASPAPAAPVDRGATVSTLLRLISARQDGEISGPAVDAKIAELTDRFAVNIVIKD